VSLASVRTQMIARCAALRAMSQLVAPRARAALVPAAHMRRYGDYHSIEDMLSASDAWHSLVPDRLLNDEAALRNTFVKLDLDGNGKIDASELRMALITMQGVPPAGFTQAILDRQVDEMIAWADQDDDGMISFDEYQKVITLGCAPDGGRMSEDIPTTTTTEKKPAVTPPVDDVIHL